MSSISIRASLSLLMIALTSWLCFQEHDLDSRGIRTSGEVADRSRSTDSNGTETYSAKFTYLVNGVKYKYSPFVAIDAPIGQKYNLVYNPDSPAISSIDTWQAIYAPAILSGSITLLLLYLTLKAWNERLKVAKPYVPKIR